MSIELVLEGTSAAGGVAQRVADWLRAGGAGARTFSCEVDPTGTIVQALLHPAAVPLDVRAVDGQVVARAQVTPVGPGYHRHLRTVLTAMAAELGLTWDEGVEQLEDEDRATVEETHRQWAEALASTMLTVIPDVNGQLVIGMPIEGDRYEHDEWCTTWLGPATKADLAAVLAGTDQGLRMLLPWWDDGWGATTLAAAAMVLLWTEVRWRPATDEDDLPHLRHVDQLLVEAHRLDPDLDLPWAAWRDVRSFHAAVAPPDPGAPADLDERAAADTRPPIGYRHRPVTSHPISGWQIRLPGNFTCGIDGSRWWAWDGVRQVDLGAQLVGDDKTGPRPKELQALTRSIRGPARPVTGCRWPTWSDGEIDEKGRTALQGTASARRGELLLMTVTAPADEAWWQEEVWRSLRYVQPS